MGEEKAQTEYRGRLAPTPSGFLHAGHIRTFSTAWEELEKTVGNWYFGWMILILPAVRRNLKKRAWKISRGWGWIGMKVLMLEGHLTL